MMNNHCPYCDSENFENEAIQVDAYKWLNQCRSCHLYSIYDEVFDKQMSVDEPQRTKG